MRLLKNSDRPFHWGPFPLEVLPRDAAAGAAERDRLRAAKPEAPASNALLATVARTYRDVFAEHAEDAPAVAKAPLPDDLARRSQDVKGFAYFMDAAMVGICEIPESAWLDGAEADAHSHAVVIMVQHGRVPEQENLAHDWIAPSVREPADMRAAEIAVVLARHIRMMGFDARADIVSHEKLDQPRLAVLGGLALRDGDEISNPFIGGDFSLAVVSTDYPLATDTPLAAGAKGGGFRYWWGRNGATSGRERRRRAKRKSHLGRYPMETVKRVERPTTLILDDEVPRVPKRAAFFERALQGDLGEKSQKERSRFSFKHPTSWGLLGVIRSLVPHQGGEPNADADQSRYGDAAANTRAIKSLSYFLGADITGICEAKDYTWYSHKPDGAAINPYHKYAVVMLIDQGFDTMEGASGDDWISGTQSMRAYLRGAEIAGVMADLMRQEGYSSRAQTNADSDVLQLPLSLLAGLGELSRIGELVLNPFLGPRIKTVVLTTDMPLEVDQPINFGLQTFCSNCLKCARECPCDAIPFGDKVVFNGYEIWKPDVERCTRYRLTNAKGAACGRCMKTCPINKVVDADGPLITRAASWLGVNAMWLKPVMVPIATWLDDKLGNGTRKASKKWWFDHEIIDKVTVEPKVGTNQRDIDPSRKVNPADQKMAYYHASMMPPPDAPGPVKLERKAALAAGELLESPAGAKARKAAGGTKPDHYAATPPVGAIEVEKDIKASPYAGGEPAKT
jgi:ferredoxin